MKTALKLALIMGLLTGGYLILDSMIVQAGPLSEINKSINTVNKTIDTAEYGQQTGKRVQKKNNETKQVKQKHDKKKKTNKK